MFQIDFIQSVFKTIIYVSICLNYLLLSIKCHLQFIPERKSELSSANFSMVSHQISWQATEGIVVSMSWRSKLCINSVMCHDSFQNGICDVEILSIWHLKNLEAGEAVPEDHSLNRIKDLKLIYYLSRKKSLRRGECRHLLISKVGFRVFRDHK